VQALVAQAAGKLDAIEVDDPKPRLGEVVVELRTAALNHRDLGIVAGHYGTPTYPLIPGSDGAGVRRDTGEDVVILPSLDWGESDRHPGPHFRILGGDARGTHAELIAIPRQNLYPKPARLSWAEAGAFPLAGLTAYRALFTRACLREGESVLVLGTGGGVSTFAVQLAVQAGARVFVTSSSEEKLDAALDLGAQAGVLYTEEGWVDEVRGLSGGAGVDVVVDSVGTTWPDSLGALCGGGRLVAFGATGGREVALDARRFFFGQWSLLGTTMGSPRDFVALLDAIDRGAWRPAIDSVRPLADGASAYERLEAGKQFGKLVLEIARSDD
jgi:NADPH:quinone reductase-like Zn-dependent oxidoreductase